MNNLLKTAITILIISTVAFLWGYWYVDTHKLKGVGAMFGYSDPTYTIASWSMILGVLAFLVGIGMLIGGLVTKSGSPDLPKFEGTSEKRRPRSQPQFCGDCGTKLQSDDRFCPNCGAKIE